MSNFKDAATILMPENGGVHTIRIALNMIKKQLESKLGLTKGANQKIKEGDATGQITINKLKDADNETILPLRYFAKKVS